MGKIKVYGYRVVWKMSRNDRLWKHRIFSCWRCIGLKMKVVVYDPFVSDEQLQKIGAKKVERKRFLIWLILLLCILH